jgi:hypothetical protein
MEKINKKEKQREKRNKFKKLKAEDLIDEYRDVFAETLTKGRFFTCKEMTIHINENVTGIRRCATSKRIPLHWKQEADELVASMIKADLIERVTKPTVWCSMGKFIQKPNGKGLRMVHNFVNLNGNVRRPFQLGTSAQDVHREILGVLHCARPRQRLPPD